MAWRTVHATELDLGAYLARWRVVRERYYLPRDWTGPIAELRSIR